MDVDACVDSRHGMNIKHFHLLFRLRRLALDRDWRAHSRMLAAVPFYYMALPGGHKYGTNTSRGLFTYTEVAHRLGLSGAKYATFYKQYAERRRAPWLMPFVFACKLRSILRADATDDDYLQLLCQSTADCGGGGGALSQLHVGADGADARRHAVAQRLSDVADLLQTALANQISIDTKRRDRALSYWLQVAYIYAANPDAALHMAALSDTCKQYSNHMSEAAGLRMHLLKGLRVLNDFVHWRASLLRRRAAEPKSELSARAAAMEVDGSQEQDSADDEPDDNANDSACDFADREKFSDKLAPFQMETTTGDRIVFLHARLESVVLEGGGGGKAACEQCVRICVEHLARWPNDIAHAVQYLEDMFATVDLTPLASVYDQVDRRQFAPGHVAHVIFGQCALDSVGQDFTAHSTHVLSTCARDLLDYVDCGRNGDYERAWRLLGRCADTLHTCLQRPAAGADLSQVTDALHETLADRVDALCKCGRACCAHRRCAPAKWWSVLHAEHGERADGVWNALVEAVKLLVRL